MIETDVNINEDLATAVDVMRKGGVILYPTDTIWGLGCDATNPEAVSRIFDIKKRAESKSMLVLVSNEAMLERYVGEVPEVAWQLLESAVNPLTIIYDDAKGLAPNLISDDGSVGIRITKERFSNELCRRLRRPIVSTSANISGVPTRGNYADIPEAMIKAVDYVALYRRDDNRESRPSNIIKLRSNGEFKLIR